MLRPLVFFIIAQPFLVLGFIWLSAVRFASANADLGLSIQLSGLHEFAHRNWGPALWGANSKPLQAGGR
jgi:hypothetical protein